ncbi:MAG: non-homologous end-joining DNA ligase, partial [Streptosporangiaceae bacterium]
MASTTTREQLKVGRLTVALSNTGKVLFTDGGITKGELIGYYQAAAEQMLPYLRERPLAMARYPDGITGERIFQKNVGRHFPDWIPRVDVDKQGGHLSQVVCAKAADLVYLANQACIELHPFLSRVERPRHPGQHSHPGEPAEPDQLHRPDMLIFDLDPPDGGHFEAVRTAALRLREILEDLGLAAFVKTTGSKGLHVQVPLNGREEFGPVREFARQVAEVLAAAEPDLVTVEQRKDARHGRVYADIMRNAYAQTAVAAYSVRARPHAPVATPVSWDEVADPALAADSFTLRAMPDRLAQLAKAGDPWAGMSRHRQGL